MIILNLKDGLGNQMFEYSFAKYLQRNSSETIAVNNFFFQNGKRRNYSLNNFKLKDKIIVFNRFQQIFYTGLFMLKLGLCYPIVFLKWIISNNRPKDEDTFLKSSKAGLYVHFNTFHKFDIIRSNRAIKFIYGNYENYCYVEDLIEELRDDFKIVTEPSIENQKMLKILDDNESVCVHIRRGDYLNPTWKMMNVCDFDYYQKSMDVITNMHPNAKFFVFSNTSDDIEWIKDNYKFKQSVEYVDLGNPDFEELRLMMHCKHFIISNSTFSWWAAVLSNYIDKTVIAPSKWINNIDDTDTSEEDSNGMYLPGWIKI